MANVCALPKQYQAGAAQDPILVESARVLADALENSAEFQSFARLAQAINEDNQVVELLHQIRERHSNYHRSENSDLVAQLEGLEVMRAYRNAETALRRLCSEIDQLAGQAAGLGFSAHIRPQGHG